MRTSLNGSRLALSALVLIASASCAEAQTGKKSQLGSVTQLVGPAKIEIIYRRPVARGRELFGKLVPYGRIWTPSADSAALFTTTTDLTVNGKHLAAGRYAMWMVPDPNNWAIVFSSDQPSFHLHLPQSKDEVLRVTAKSHEGDYVETLAFYFPMVDGDSAILNMHWGRTVVPIMIKAH